MNRATRALLASALLTLGASAPAAQERAAHPDRGPVASGAVRAAGPRAIRAERHGRSYGAPHRIRCAPPVHRFWVPGRWTHVWVEASYRTVRRPCGTTYRVLVRPGHYERVWQPGHYATRPPDPC